VQTTSTSYPSVGLDFSMRVNRIHLERVLVLETSRPVRFCERFPEIWRHEYEHRNPSQRCKNTSY